MHDARLLVVTVAVSGAFAVAGKLWALDWMVWVFKPLATIAIAATVVRRARAPAAQDHASRAYGRAVLAGLLLSLAGDILLIPPDAFVAGLVAFLLAHLAYLYAFTRHVPLLARRLPALAVVVVTAAVLALLWPRLPPALRAPVLMYVTMLAAMVAQAWSRALSLGDRPARRAALGASLFLLSDALLAIDRFHTPLPLAPLLVLGTYWPAQVAIALSVPPASGTVPDAVGARDRRTSR